MGIDPKTAYWTGALVNMGVVFALLLAGALAIRRGRVRLHKRCMLTAAALVGVFLLSYVGKLAFLGREQLELWSSSYVWTLRFHEACVAGLVIGGGVAIYQAVKLNLFARESSPPGTSLPEGTHRHRRAGWTAIVGAGLGILSAAYILQGMYVRS
jgi:uncharacterized membrane protein YozB (DUF420 family)